MIQTKKDTLIYVSPYQPMSQPETNKVAPVPIPRQRPPHQHQHGMLDPTNNEQVLNVQNLQSPNNHHHRRTNSQVPHADGRAGVYNLPPDSFVNIEQSYQHQHHHGHHDHHHHHNKGRTISPGGVSRRSDMDEQDHEILKAMAGGKKDKRKADTSSRGRKVESLLLGLQISFILLFALFVTYDEDQMVPEKPRRRGQDGKSPKDQKNSWGSGSGGGYPYSPPSPIEEASPERPKQNLHEYYYLYQDVQVMIFIGFGFLMNFLRKYGYSALGITMLIGALSIQWSILCRGFFHHDEHGMIQIDITTMINADFAAGAVLISVGAVIGVATPFQLIVLCLVEILFYALNEYIGTELFQAIDVGGSMYIHAFGAYFGLAMSRMMKPNKEINLTNEAATKNSDLFAMIGTIFLWVYWPSFNGALAHGDDQHRAVMHTVLSLTGSLIFTFIISTLIEKDNKLNMVHVQNATLAGGVAVGAVADLMLKPFGALIIGSLAGTISTLGYVYLTPFLQSKLGLHDTCGINNLHGMTGIIGGLAGTLMAALATEAEYGYGLYVQYPARAPLINSSELSEIKQELLTVEAGDNRTAGMQAMYQISALGVTLLIAIVGGSLTGLLLRAPIFGKVPAEEHFDDTFLWEVPEEEESGGKAVENTNGVSNYRTFEMSGDNKANIPRGEQL